MEAGVGMVAVAERALEKAPDQEGMVAREGSLHRIGNRNGAP